jgi:DivIVA domain-containing protein
VTLLLTLLILAVVGLVAAVAAGRIAGGLDEPSSSLPGRGLPAGRVGAGDLERVRFSPALRGYRMDEVDDVLDRVTEELELRDEEIAELRSALGRPPRHEAAEPPATPRWRRPLTYDPDLDPHRPLDSDLGGEPLDDPRNDPRNDLRDELGNAAFLPPAGTHDERGRR